MKAADIFIDNPKDSSIIKEPSDRRFPSVEVANARIKLALLKYKITLERVAPSKGKEVINNG